METQSYSNPRQLWDGLSSVNVFSRIHSRVSSTARLLNASVLVFSLLSGCDGSAQATHSSAIESDRLRGHIHFLASDALAGRASASRDEAIAATYVASQLLSYGVQMAPGMTSYVQSADVTKPEFDGHAELRLGNLTFNENTDLSLLVATSGEFQGEIRLTTIKEMQTGLRSPGTFLMVEGSRMGTGPRTLLGLAHQAGAFGVIVPRDEATAKYLEQHDRKPFTTLQLKGSPQRSGVVLALSLQAFTHAKESLPMTAQLSIKALPDVSERKTYNTIGYLPGRDTRAGNILLTAHLDHLGHGHPVAGDDIYNGANDDASGVVAVLEIARVLAEGPKLRRGVLIVCYGSEEEGDLGSTYFAEHAPIPLSTLVANLEFEMVGVADPNMPKHRLMFTGWDRSDLGPVLRTHGAPLAGDPYPQEHFFERSDNYALALRGIVAHTVSAWPLTPTYHQPDDNIDHIDIPFMGKSLRAMVKPIRWLANSTFTPQWTLDGRPH